MTLTPGATLQNGRFIIQSVSAETAYDVTYTALHSYLGQEIFLKSLNEQHRSAFNIESTRQYFNHKVALFAQSKHPSLIDIIDGFEEEGIPYVAVLAPSGQSLPSWLHEHASVSPSEAIALLTPLVEALQFLHQIGVFHGHLSARSVIVQPDHPALMLSDITLSSFLPDEAIAHVGEDLLNHILPSKARLIQDIQAVAAIAYALLTGSAQSLQMMARSHDIADLQDDSYLLSPAVNQAIAQGLNPNSSETISNWFQSLVQAAVEHHAASDRPEDWADPASMPLPPESDPSSNELASGMTVVKSSVTSGTRSHRTPPDSVSPSDISNPHRHQQRSPQPRKNQRWHIPMLLGTSSIVAASFGGYLGLSLRLQEPEQLEQSPIFGQEVFGSEQSFPESDDWPGRSSYGLNTSRFLFEDRQSQSLYDSPSEDELILPETDSEIDTLQSDYEFSEDLQIGSDLNGALDSETEPTIKDEEEASIESGPGILTAPESSAESSESQPEDPDKLIREPPPSTPEGWPSLLNDASADGNEAPSVSSVEIQSRALSDDPSGMDLILGA